MPRTEGELNQRHLTIPTPTQIFRELYSYCMVFYILQVVPQAGTLILISPQFFIF